MKVSREMISEIETMSVRGDDSSIGIILLHGYGANMNDLFPLWELWHQDKFNWYFPNGIQSLPMGYYEGRSWFSIDVARLEEAMRLGKHRDLSSEIPVEFEETIKRLELFIAEISKRHEKIIIGGFSQGAMCASHLAMKPNLKIEALILLSGALIAESHFPKVAKGIPFYQSHGIADPILSYDGAKALEQRLLSLNLKGKLHAFRGGHEIPGNVIHEVKNFLSLI
ncbi:MAG: alpha/beta hydrolase [Bacteriovoracaceae bacterium]